MKNTKEDIRKIPKLIFIYINRLYNRLYFIFNKQRTIQEMFKPIIDNKVTINSNLLSELKEIRKENTLVKNKIISLTRSNKAVENKISILQELLIKRP